MRKTMTMTKMMTMTKTKTPLLDDLPTLCLVVEEDDVDLLGQLRHGGEDEGERRDDHHRHRGERANLEKIFCIGDREVLEAGHL